ncbi:uncharacterized protein BO80DRAFT_121160 [Aspergillus ibericus CBS 121593]|uniref:Uncharacterized protein n=1 Tax=Aspergillus ibericus CBS 121593 TaxID=1448316 RepID=A0A395GVT0_9EURO|nr:hypothetical protein BO80DRAFT_121160 [Aspergillus ibericus CBS 121593]RAK99680.1 hypothetical protein BO80DRAFT_121160 [Aspergillus ibericus CBS 121593]
MTKGGDRQNRRSPKILVLCVGAVLKRAVGVPRGRVGIGDFAGTVYSKSNNEDVKKGNRNRKKKRQRNSVRLKLPKEEETVIKETRERFRTVLEVFRLECRSDDTFLDSVMQARLCVRLRSLRFFLRGSRQWGGRCKAPK